jgi:hypothetical protein
MVIFGLSESNLSVTGLTCDNQSVNCIFFSSEIEDGGTVPGLSQAARRQISYSSSGRSSRGNQDFVDISAVLWIRIRDPVPF